MESFIQSQRKSAFLQKTCILLGLLPLSLLMSCSKKETTTTPIPDEVSTTPISAFKPISFIEYDLTNGLHVILHQDRSAPVISTYVLYKVGSKDENQDRTGFAHFFEHLMFEGSENIKRGEIDKYISSSGGNLNASTSFDQTDYYINLPSNKLKLALWIESERMLHAKVDEVGVETQRQVVKEERRMRYDNQPYGSLFENLAGLVFKGTPYSWTPIGSVQYIDQAKIEEFRNFYKKYYVPNNAVLSVAGDIDIEKTKQWIEEYFGSIPRGNEISRPEIELPVQTQSASIEVIEPHTPLSATLHAWHASKETDPDAYPLDLLTSILATGRSSRLYKKLVDEEQVALQVSAFPFFQEKVGMIGIFAMGNQGVELNKIDRLIEQEIEKIKQQGVTDIEFQKVRNQKEAELASAHGSMQSRASNLARYHAIHGNTDLINKEIEHYLQLKREDLQHVAQKYFNSNTLNVIRYVVPSSS